MKPDIKKAFGRWKPDTRAVLETVRHTILDVAKGNSDIGPLTETLKWGEPAYLTEATKAGSTLRLGQTRSEQKPALFVNCQTTLIDEFRELYPDTFTYEGTRAVVLPTDLDAASQQLRHCIALTLTYHHRKRVRV